MMLVSALLLTSRLAWSLYDEAFGQRPWKGMQREFVSRYTKYLDSIKANAGKTEAEVKRVRSIRSSMRRRRQHVEKVKPEIDEIDKEVKLAFRESSTPSPTVSKSARQSHGHQLQRRNLSKAQPKKRYRRRLKQKRQRKSYGRAAVRRWKVE